MRSRLNQCWFELTTYITKEQTFLLSLYFAFTAYLKNNKIGTTMNQGETGEISDLKQLREIFKKIPGYDLKMSVNDFEESIAWQIFEMKQPCGLTARSLKREIECMVRGEDDLECLIEDLEELVGEMDNLIFTPKSVNTLLSLLPVNAGTDSFADLYCGLSGTGLEIWKLRKELAYAAEEQRKLYCDISRIRMFCHGIEKPEVFKRDTLEENDGQVYDLVAADLPKGNNESVYVKEQDDILGKQEKIFIEWISIQKILKKVSDNGKAFIIVTKGALVRQREWEIRENLIERDWLEAVITLPQNMYASTHLGFELLIFNKNKSVKYKNKVFFADLSEWRVREKSYFYGISKEGIQKLIKAYEGLESYEDFSTVVVRDIIQKNENSWNPYLYLKLQKTRGRWEKTVELGEIAEISRGVQITKEEERVLSQNGTHYWLNIRNIDEQGIIPEEESKLCAKSGDWEIKFGIQEDDIILTSKVTVLKACIVEPDPPKAFLCGNLTRIRVDKEKYSPYVLYEFLCSEEGKAVLESIQSGTTIKVLSNKNLAKMPVPIYKDVVYIGEKLKQANLEHRNEIRRIEEQYELKRKMILKELRNREA